MNDLDHTATVLFNLELLLKEKRLRFSEMGATIRPLSQVPKLDAMHLMLEVEAAFATVCDIHPSFYEQLREGWNGNTGHSTIGKQEIKDANTAESTGK